MFNVLTLRSAEGIVALTVVFQGYKTSEMFLHGTTYNDI